MTVQPGITVLLGPNGAGKSTLLKTLSTVQPPASGSLTVDDIIVTSAATARKARRQIGYLPQSFGFEPRMSVRDFIMYGAWMRGVERKDRASMSSQVLEYVGLQDSAKVKMGKLSGGMRQRAGIAWAIVGNPRNVILDEPTIGLDPQQRFRFRELMLGLKEQSIVLSTHLTDDAEAIGDRIVVINRGAIVFDGSAAQMKLLDNGQNIGYSAIERAYMELLPPGDRAR